MDSGGASGRHWQRPLPSKAIWFEVSEWGGRKHLEPYIALHHFLDAHFEIDRDLTRMLHRECRKRKDWNYEIYGQIIAEKTGLTVRVGDYSYNWENDLTQDFQFSVLSAKDDWLYDESALFVIETHNGADARGGFSDPVVARQRDDASFMDTVAGVAFISVLNAKGNALDPQVEDEHYQVGYTSNPSYEFDKDIAEILEADGQENRFRVRMTSGNVVEGYFYFRDGNGGIES
jgi:hypothetical protein